MIYLSLSSATSTTDNLAFTVTKSTNGNIIISGTNIQITSPGLYEVVGEVTATSTATSGNYGVSVYANNTLSGISSVASSSATGEVVTLPVYTVIDVASTSNDGYVTVTLVPTGSPTISGGVISIKKIS